MAGLIGKYAFCLGVILTAPAANAACYDLRKAEPQSLTGMLSYRIFPGPPEYQDVQKGDTPEPGYVLTLQKDICLDGDAEFADPKEQFKEVQLVGTETSESKLAAFNNKEVTVSLERPMAAHTGHHHRPLVAWVTNVAPVQDITQEYGTAASTVRAFYYALQAGDGATAANFVVEEKRRDGPLSENDLTAFYGKLVEPLELVSITSAGSGQYTVNYSFKTTSRVCDGRAVVTTVKRGEQNFIAGIKSLSGC